MLKNLRRLLKDEEAPTAVEYALMVVGIAIAIIVAVKALGTNVNTAFDNAAKHVEVK